MQRELTTETSWLELLEGPSFQLTTEANDCSSQCAAEMTEKARPRRRQNRATLGNLRTLHVLVPEEAYVQARVAAIASAMPFKDYIAKLLRMATPIQHSANSPANASNTAASPAGFQNSSGDPIDDGDSGRKGTATDNRQAELINNGSANC